MPKIAGSSDSVEKLKNVHSEDAEVEGKKSDRRGPEADFFHGDTSHSGTQKIAKVESRWPHACKKIRGFAFFLLLSCSQMHFNGYGLTKVEQLWAFEAQKII